MRWLSQITAALNRIITAYRRVQRVEGGYSVSKCCKYLLLLPIAILIAFSLYFNNITKQIKSAMLQERLLSGSDLYRLFDSVNYGWIILIAATAVLNIAMIYIIYRFTNAGKK